MSSKGQEQLDSSIESQISAMLDKNEQTKLTTFLNDIAMCIRILEANNSNVLESNWNTTWNQWINKGIISEQNRTNIKQIICPNESERNMLTTYELMVEHILKCIPVLNAYVIVTSTGMNDDKMPHNQWTMPELTKPNTRQQAKLRAEIPDAKTTTTTNVSNNNDANSNKTEKDKSTSVSMFKLNVSQIMTQEVEKDLSDKISFGTSEVESPQNDAIEQSREEHSDDNSSIHSTIEGTSYKPKTIDEVIKENEPNYTNFDDIDVPPMEQRAHEFNEINDFSTTYWEKLRLKIRLHMDKEYIKMRALVEQNRAVAKQDVEDAELQILQKLILNENNVVYDDIFRMILEDYLCEAKPSKGRRTIDEVYF